MPEAPGPRALLVPASDRSLLVSFGDRIGAGEHDRVLRLLARLDRDPPPGLVDLSPAYASILLRFDPLRTSLPDLSAQVETLLRDPAASGPAASRLVTVPVRYGGADGPDLEDVARWAGIDPARVIERHAAVTYTVFFLGFSPGFAYLGRVPETIACPRLDRPRRTVPAGSVGIAGEQTGVYPQSVPGGWRLIGRTPLVLFDPARSPMSLLRIGDQVRFAPIDAAGDR